MLRKKTVTRPASVLLAVFAISHTNAGDDCQTLATWTGTVEEAAFGVRVDLDDDHAVVVSQEVNGRLHIFRRDAGGPNQWSQTAVLEPPDGGDFYSVAMSGGTLVVDGDDVAYIYQRVGKSDTWSFIKELEHPSAGSDLGHHVAISGDTVVSGAPTEGEYGAVHIFSRHEGGADNWGYVAAVIPPLTYAPDRFGDAVDIDGDFIVVGDRFADEPVTHAGAAYVLHRNEGGADNWGVVSEVSTHDAQERQFGFAVSISGEQIIVTSQSGSYAGPSAHIYNLQIPGDPGSWAHTQTLRPPSNELARLYGYSTSIAGEVAVVGAPYADGLGGRPGAAYVHHRNLGGPDQWGLAEKVAGTDGEYADLFAFHVATDGTTLVVGAPWRDTVEENEGLAVIHDVTIADCNCNGAPDDLDVTGGASEDCNGNMIPDECESNHAWNNDCNDNGVPDDCEMEGNDCNGNGVLDVCEAIAGVVNDCNNNVQPDICDFAYVHDNGSSEGFTSIAGTVVWLNTFIVEPGKETIGAIEVNWGSSPPGNDATLLIYADPNNDGDPTDAVLLAQYDVLTVETGYFSFAFEPIEPIVLGEPGDVFFVGGVGVPHGVETGVRGDVDTEAAGCTTRWYAYGETIDLEDLSNNDSPPQNGCGAYLVRAITYEGVTCLFLGDVNLDGVVNADDLAIVLGNWGPCPAPPDGCVADLNGDGEVGPGDLAIVLGNWG